MLIIIIIIIIIIVKLICENEGSNEYCLDVNFGGTLCIFDRLFGTFVEENENVFFLFIYFIIFPLIILLIYSFIFLFYL